MRSSFHRRTSLVKECANTLNTVNKSFIVQVKKASMGFGFS